MIVSSSHNLVFISRPGRPPKRMTPITTFANMPNPDPTFLGAMSNNFQGGIPFPPPQQQHPRDLPPGFNPFLHSLGGSSGVSAQMAQHAQVVTSVSCSLSYLIFTDPRPRQLCSQEMVCYLEQPTLLQLMKQWWRNMVTCSDSCRGRFNNILELLCWDQYQYHIINTY